MSYLHIVARSVLQHYSETRKVISWPDRLLSVGGISHWKGFWTKTNNKQQNKETNNEKEYVGDHKPAIDKTAW